MKLAARLTKAVLLLASFALSLVLYLYVQSPAPPERIQLLVHAENLQQGLVLNQEGSPVVFSVSGPGDAVSRLVQNLKRDPEYVLAVVDLRRYRAADVPEKGLTGSPVELVVKPANEVENLTFKEEGTFFPVLERLETKTIPIKAKFGNASASDVSGYEPADFETMPSTVVVTGPASSISKAEASVIINPAETERVGMETHQLSLSGNVTTTLRDTQIEVHAAHHTRAVFVNINFVGHVRSGYRVSNFYVVSPQSQETSTAMIRGLAGLIDRTSSIDASVDISGLTKGFTFETKPKLPEGVELLESPLRIRVDIEKIPR